MQRFSETIYRRHLLIHNDEFGYAKRGLRLARHVVVLCYNVGLNLLMIVWRKTLIDIIAEILMFLQ